MQYKTLAIFFASVALADEIDKLSSDAALVSLYTYPTWVLDAESRHHARLAYAATATQDWLTFSESSTSATATTTSSASLSSLSSGSSVSTGGAPAVTGDVFMGLAGAAGILGLAVAL
ncbi:unnamed protein product [Penicillium glandicola]